MIKQITVYEQDYGFTEGKTGNVPTWYFCRQQLRRRFALPQKRKVVVTFTAYEEPGKGRVKVELNGTEIALDGKCHYDWQTETEDAILRLLQKHGTFYVGCEYE